jgi:modulator of FtsH protease
VSINLEQVLKYRALPPRAVETLSILIGLLVLSVFILIPGQSLTALGIEILVLGVILGTALLVKRIRLPRAAGQPLTWTLTPVGVILAATLPMAAAGISVLVRAGGGLYWLVAALILGFAGAVVNAWILLVEIHR